MNYSVCIDSVLPGKTAAEALKCVRESGLGYYEFWTWWNRDCDELLQAQKETGVKPVAMCTKFISLTDASRRKEYIEGLKGTIAVCDMLGCKTIISQVGAELKGVSREEQHQSIVAGLKACRSMLEDHGITLAVEPLNTRIDHPGYYLTAAREAFEIVDEAGSPWVKVLYDLYHQHISEGIDLPLILHRLEQIAHFHIAGYPGRHEPLEPNEIDYPTILKAIGDKGYQRFAGLEYFPVKEAKKGLMEWHDSFCPAPEGIFNPKRG